MPLVTESLSSSVVRCMFFLDHLQASDEEEMVGAFTRITKDLQFDMFRPAIHNIS